MTSSTLSTVLFVGESPPPEAPANFRPFDCASGTRLARSVLGLVDRAALLEHVPLANLFDRATGPKGTPPWQPGAAMSSAEAMLAAHAARGVRSFVLLGSRVAEAFGAGHLVGPVSSTVLMRAWPGRAGGEIGVNEAPQAHPLAAPCVVYTRAPHPSGAPTALNAPEVVREVRRALLPELVAGCPTLRPWHFRLDDPAVLEDLALALAPLRPSAGLVALEWAASQHKTRLASPPGSLLARIRGLADEAQEVRPGVPPDSGPPYPSEAARLRREDEAAVRPPWDEPLARTVADLLQPDGCAALSARWDEGGGPKPTVRGRKSWLMTQVGTLSLDRLRALDHLSLTPTARATTLRYAIAGMGAD